MQQVSNTKGSVVNKSDSTQSSTITNGQSRAYTPPITSVLNDSTPAPTGNTSTTDNNEKKLTLYFINNK